MNISIADQIGFVANDIALANPEFDGMPVLRAILATLQAHESALRRVERLENALRFYADLSRYQGGNQRRLPGDEYTPVGAPYRQDVTRDNGAFARAALADSGSGG